MIRFLLILVASCCVVCDSVPHQPAEVTEGVIEVANDFPPPGSMTFQSGRVGDLFAQFMKGVDKNSPSVNVRLWLETQQSEKVIPAAYNAGDQTIWVSGSMLQESDALISFLLAHEYGHVALHASPQLPVDFAKKTSTARFYAY
jgi:hypothetical protein